MSETKELNWATLGCGVIANELANALAKQGRKLYSVANRTHDKLSHLHKNLASKKFTIRSMKYLKIRMWMSFTSPRHTTHILLTCAKRLPVANMFSARNRSL